MTVSSEVKSCVTAMTGSLKDRTYSCVKRWEGKSSSRSIAPKDIPYMKEAFDALRKEWDSIEGSVSSTLGEELSPSDLKPLRSQRATCLALLNQVQTKVQKRLGC
jgi:hypothetical protein